MNLVRHNTTAPAERPPRKAHDVEIVLVDFGTGRFSGGHQEDYLGALEHALRDQRVHVLAPFRAATAKPGRAGIYWREFQAFRRLLAGNAHGGCIIVCHSPEFRDFLLFRLAALIRRQRANAVGLFVLRRTGAGIVGRDNVKARLLELLIPQMVRDGLLYPASDSRRVLDYWLARVGDVIPTLLSIPAPPAAAAVAQRPGDGPVIGLFGRFRIEKGARHYDAVIRTALSLFADATVRVQLATDSPGEAGEIARRLLREWQSEPRVVLLDGHLTSSAYAAQIASTDVVVLPYESESYGSGTSGVLHDALALGRTVLVAPIAWATDAYPRHPAVVWLTGTDAAALAAGLRAAVVQALSARRAGATGGPADTFAADWQRALTAAARLLPESASV